HNDAKPDWAIDALRVGDEEAPQLGTLDPEVLDWAVKAGRIIVSRDVTTLIAEHDEFVARGGWTPGLLIVKKGYSIPEVVEYLSLVCHVADADDFSCRCSYIPT
ncbi:MAG: hypothetical protein JOZ58_20830, partial [Acetobacteraceae bacterium]|nr:hypothetical protein [Acetobacteraceae bacterium]